MSDTSIQLTINGLPRGGGRAVQERIRADGDGDVACPRYETSVHWVSGYQTRTQVRSGAVLQGDEPSTYGGADLGATPQELLLSAVGNCLAATYIGGLTAAGIEVRSLRLDVSGRVNFRAAFGVLPGAPGFESIHVKVALDADAPQAQLDALLARLLPTAPIPDTISRPVPLDVQIQHVDQRQNP
ncbi:OsmC family protein [Pandoraea oxalativorans]|uniref:Osmotically inducible protein OsmC n=1 Tax=Pandoraea oxalativorans TaxID=573737 RepID=A0A0E3U9N0_9BURK|nr:OsmC family protein [Pandoraea oxalativorans]AKC72333.1 osmotically inducible protein OsmC [Pandoraea oxalativorans]